MKGDLKVLSFNNKEKNLSPWSTRRRSAPVGTGCEPGTAYHWYIGAVRAQGGRGLESLMEGLKFKVGHRRPHWKGWSYEYPEQEVREEIVEEALNYLRESRGMSFSVTG